MSVELERVSRIHALIDAANSKTGNADTALTDRTAQPLTLHATTGVKLTVEQITSATAKNWTLSY